MVDISINITKPLRPTIDQNVDNDLVKLYKRLATRQIKAKGMTHVQSIGLFEYLLLLKVFIHHHVTPSLSRPVRGETAQRLENIRQLLIRKFDAYELTPDDFIAAGSHLQHPENIVIQTQVPR